MALSIAAIPEIQWRLKRTTRELRAVRGWKREGHKIATVRQMCEGPA